MGLTFIRKEEEAIQSKFYLIQNWIKQTLDLKFYTVLPIIQKPAQSIPLEKIMRAKAFNICFEEIVSLIFLYSILTYRTVSKQEFFHYTPKIR